MDEIRPLSTFEEAAKADIGFLLVGHGTRRARGQQQLQEVFSEFEKLLKPANSAFSFLELADPDIPTAIQQLQASGVRAIVTVPVLLFSAGHAQQDIPNAVDRACEECGVKALTQTEPFESAGPILELSALRFRESVCDQECLDTGSCNGEFCNHCSLVMIGRGSSSDMATRAMRKFSRHRCTDTVVEWLETAFIHAQSPSVDQALDSLEHRESELKVVQPHLLFEGQLVEELREKVAERQKRDPTKKWVITNTLGTDHQLSVTLASLAENALRKAKNRSL